MSLLPAAFEILARLRCFTISKLSASELAKIYENSNEVLVVDWESNWSEARDTGQKPPSFCQKNSKIVFDVISRFEILRFREAMNRKFLDLQNALPNAWET